MPIYEFKCETCSHIDEVLMKINDPNPAQCSACGGQVHKIMSQTTFSLKGSGWYVTDYKSNSPNSQEPSAPQTTSPSATTTASPPSETNKQNP